VQHLLVEGSIFCVQRVRYQPGELYTSRERILDKEIASVIQSCVIYDSNLKFPTIVNNIKLYYTVRFQIDYTMRYLDNEPISIAFSIK